MKGTFIMHKRKTYELKHDKPGKDFKISVLKSAGIPKLKSFHSHTYFEIAHFDIGPSSPNNFAKCENGNFRIEKSSIVLFPPNCSHYVNRGNAATDRILINCTYDFINPIAEFLDINLNYLFKTPVLNFSDRQISHLKDLSYEMLKEYKKYNNMQKTNSRLRLLFTNFLYILTQAEFKAMPEHITELKINNVIDYINRNYFDNISLDFLSERFFISKYELCRKIKKVTGLTYSSYLMRLRINHARELLESSALTVNEISSQMGFHSSAYFSSSFKKALGISPNDYRKNFLKNI